MSRTERTYSARVDYNQTLTEMINVGKYDWVNSNITQEHFPIEGEAAQEVDLVLVHLNRWARTSEVEAEIKKQGLRPADLAELLAFGAKYPDVQKQFPIAALGSVWVSPSGNRYVPYLDGSWNGERGLDLRWYEDHWDDYWRFLAAHA